MLSTGFGMLDFFHKPKFYGILGEVFNPISYFLSKTWLCMVLGGKSLQKHPVNAGAHKGSILGQTLFLLYTNGLLEDVIYYTIYFYDTTLFSKCEQASDLFQQLELAFELKSDL